MLATPDPVDLSALQPAAITSRFKARGLGVQAKAQPNPAGTTFYGDAEQVVQGYGGVLYTLVLDHQ